MRFEQLVEKYNALSFFDQRHFAHAYQGYIDSVYESLPKQIQDQFVDAKQQRRIMPVASEHRRLDSFARLITGDEVVGAVVIHKKQLIVATNENTQAPGSPLFERTDKLCNFLKKGAPDKFINKRVTEDSVYLMELLLSPEIKTLYQTQKQYAQILIAKNRNASAVATLNASFWLDFETSFNKLMTMVFHELAEGLYEHLSGKSIWMEPHNADSFIARFCQKYGIRLNADQREIKADDKYLPLFMGKDALFAKLETAFVAPAGVQFKSGKSSVAKNLNNVIKKSLLLMIRSYTDLLLLMDYALDDDAPLHQVIDIMGVDYDIKMLEGKPGEEGVHAEMRILAYLKSKGWLPDVNYIGITKLSCPNCHLIFKNTAPYLETASVDDSMVRGGHSNIPLWPIGIFHREDEPFLKGLLGPGYAHFNYLDDDGKSLLFDAITHFYQYMNASALFAQVGVTSSLGRVGGSSFAPISVTSLGKVKPKHAIEYFVCMLDRDASSKAGCNHFWNEHQLLCLPYWRGKPLIRGLSQYKKIRWTYAGSPFIADEGRIANLQMPLYAMMLLYDMTFDSKMIKDRFAAEIAAFKKAEPKTMRDFLFWQEIMQALDKPKVSGNELIRILFEQDTSMESVKSEMLSGRYGPGENPYRYVDEFRTLMRERGEMTIFDAIDRLGLKSDFDMKLSRLYRHLSTPLDTIEELEEVESSVASSGVSSVFMRSDSEISSTASSVESVFNLL